MNPKLAFTFGALVLMFSLLIIIWQIDLLVFNPWYYADLQKLIIFAAFGIVIVLNILMYQKTKEWNGVLLTIFLFCCMAAVYYLFLH